MVRKILRMFGSFTATSLLAASVGYSLLVAAHAVKDQSRLPEDPHIQTPHYQAPQDEEDSAEYDNLLPSNIPEVRRVELTAASARRAIDAFVVIRDKYSEKGIEQYETLEEFANKAPGGKALPKDVKNFGFTTIGAWNDTIMNVGFAYSAIAEDSVPEIKLQIEDVRADKSLSEQVRNKMISSLKTLIPSANNMTIVKDLLKDPIYADKLHLLSEQE